MTRTKLLGIVGGSSQPIGTYSRRSVARELVLPQAGEVIERLLLGPSQALARALLFDQQDALPQQVNETALIAEPLDGFLEGGHPAAGDAEDVEEFVVKGLCLAPLVMRVAPVKGELFGSTPDFVPTQAHMVRKRQIRQWNYGRSDRLMRAW